MEGREGALQEPSLPGVPIDSGSERQPWQGGSPEPAGPSGDNGSREARELGSGPESRARRRTLTRSHKSLAAYLLEKTETDVELSREKLRLLYLVSLYTSYRDGDDKRSAAGNSGSSSDAQERWIRVVPVLVLVYEGILQEVFDYDYAPQADIVGSHRVYLNISQEGRDDIDHLREKGLLLALKLTSKTYTSTMALRISEAGRRHLDKHITDEDKEAIHEVVYSPGSDQTELLDIVWVAAQEEFVLMDHKAGWQKASGITEIEAVAYVSSPYIAMPLRRWGRKTNSSVHRVAEILGTCGSTIKDNLSENITLDDVHIMVCEWIPMGGNQIAALNDRLGSTERVQGGLFTSRIDEQLEDTQLSGNVSGLTQCTVLDYDDTDYVNFEAEVFFPNEGGISQVENFGVHFAEHGLVIYGVRLDAIMDRIRKNLSLDLISRLLVDILDDSSEVASNLLSSHQTSILECIFLGDSGNRGKFSVVMAEGVTPKLPAAMFMDKDANENEIKQIIGDTSDGYDLSDQEVLIVGRNGVLLMGPDVRRHEPVLLTYVSLQTRNTFMRSVFYRSFILADVLRHTRELIDAFEEDPNNIRVIRETISVSTEDVITLAEVQEFLVESLGNIGKPEPLPQDEASAKLVEALDLERLGKTLHLRSMDLEKTIEGSRNELAALRGMSEVIAESAKMRTQEGLAANTKNLEDCFRAGQRQSQSLEVMQIILAGSMAFQIVDRTTGQYLNLDPDQTEWATRLVLPMQKLPAVWFLINFSVWVVVAAGLIWFMRHLEFKSCSVYSTKIRLNRRARLDNLREFLSSRDLVTIDTDHQKTSTCRRYVWTESDTSLWGGKPPKIELLVDERYSYVLQVFLESNKRLSKLDAVEVKQRFFQILESYDVWDGEDPDAMHATFDPMAEGEG